jgi:hypothetical protein
LKEAEFGAGNGDCALEGGKYDKIVTDKNEEMG